MLSKGSQWHRWDPHIHSPGTVLNDQFSGQDAWGDFISAIESSTPPIKALGLTDYYLTENYQKLVKHKKEGGLAKVDFIFPNIEMRLDIAVKDRFVNVHLLVSPEDEDHLPQLERLLSRLQFDAHKDRFNCTRQDLIRLGKAAKPGIGNDQDALQHGITQFKVNFANLKEVITGNEWAKNNVLVAVPASSRDGTSSISEPAGATIRQEIEAFAHIIFSGNPRDRDFWLGRGPCDEDRLRSRYNGLKPCLHGSDAHSTSSVGDPSHNRFSWIKGSLGFTSLKQACIDPANRVYIGEKPPENAIPSEIISSIKVKDAEWFEPTEIPLNCGLVSIIGARGSGKTALVEMIAAGCNSVPEITRSSSDLLSSSFLVRARPHLADAQVTLHWASGDSGCHHLDGRNIDSTIIFPRARYLSQQFVTELCLANEHPGGLSKEIERVIFDALPPDVTDGAADFSELRELRTQRYQQSHVREAESIRRMSEHISKELEKEHLKDIFEKEVTEKKTQIRRYEVDLQKLTTIGSDTRVERYRELQRVIQEKRRKRKQFNVQKRALLNLRDEVNSMRRTGALEMLRECQRRNPDSGILSEDWVAFMLDYKGPVDEILEQYIDGVDKQIVNLVGQPAELARDEDSDLPNNADLSTLALQVLEEEIVRVEKQLQTDRLVQNRYSELYSVLSRERNNLEKLESRLEDASSAADRRRTLQKNRSDAYERVFDAIVAEERELNELYSPLKERLAQASGTLRKLGISTFRRADAAAWAEYAEENLLDRRQAGPFRGRGALVKIVESKLKPAWETGAATEVKDAMDRFIKEYFEQLLSHAPVRREQHSAYRAWLRQFAEWLFRTDHIRVQYGITYDNIDIDKLSPGTRGIVLLLLYLALDADDSRPLIIDQPEENLDPKSVFDELVPLFVEAKMRRQVIIVTHNANLVVNTDSDQIIIAQASPMSSHDLPLLTYDAGGLEDTAIRKTVCDILEGGELAFQERARRMGVQLAR